MTKHQWAQRTDRGLDSERNDDNRIRHACGARGLRGAFGKFGKRAVALIISAAMLGSVAGATVTAVAADSSAEASTSVAQTLTSETAANTGDGNTNADSGSGADSGTGTTPSSTQSDSTSSPSGTSPSETAASTPSSPSEGSSSSSTGSSESDDLSSVPTEPSEETAAPDVDAEPTHDDKTVAASPAPATVSKAAPAQAEAGDSDVKVSLFDYYEESSSAYQNNNGKLNVNSATCGAFWFNGNPPEQYNCGNRYSVPGVAGENYWYSGVNPTQGLVESDLNAEGYPTLSEEITDNYHGSYASSTMPNSNMEFLFSESSYAKAYSNVSGLFNVNNGHYSYDSTQQFAQLTGSEKSGWSIEYKTAIKDQGGSESAKFIPFNAVDDSGKLTRYGAVAPASGTNPNLSFGMTVETQFLQPKDGQIVTGKNEDGTDKTENMKFSFNGDDDVWVFIDGKLVLDIGGIHGARGGSIDFATGTVHVDGHDDTTLASLMGFAEGKTTFDDYSTHTLKFFYLERGAGASNCQLDFNLQTIPEGTISVGKRITESNTAAFSDASFTMSVQTSKSKDSGYSLYTGKYYVCPLNGVCTRPDDSGLKQIAADGKFMLKNNERAVLVGDENHPIDASTYYKVTEYTADNYDQEDYQFTLDGVKDESGDQIGDVDLGDASPAVRVDDHRLVVVNNKFLKKDKYTFQVTKQMASGSDLADGQQFTMHVTNGDGEAYTGKYYLSNDGGATFDTAKQYDATNGDIVLSAGQAARIVDVAAGTTFRVDEDTSKLEGYESPVYADNEASDANSGESEQAVTVGRGSANGEITVTNVRLAPANRKYIQRDSGPAGPKDSYTLNLDVTGGSASVSSASATNTPVDVLLVVDNSNSMQFCVGDHHPSSGTDYCSDAQRMRWRYVKQSVSGLVDSLFDARDAGRLDLRVGVVKFARSASSVQGFSSSRDLVSEAVNGLGPANDDGGTDWYSALRLANGYQGREGAGKYVVFVTDGQATRTNGESNSKYGEAWRADTFAQGVRLVDAGWNVLNVGVDLFAGDGGGLGLFTDFNGELAERAGSDGDPLVRMFDAQGTGINGVFDQIGQAIARTTSYSIGNVTITDVLTGWAEPYTIVGGEPKVWGSDGGSPGKTLTIGALGAADVQIDVRNSEDDIKEVPAGTKATYTPSSKRGETGTVTVEFPKGYTLADGYTYTVRFRVRPTDAAYKAYADGKQQDPSYAGPNTGEPTTDDPALDAEDKHGSWISDGKPGFFTNTTAAKVSYCVARSENGSTPACGTTDESHYKRPVLQVVNGSVSWEKADSENRETKLGGSEWKLERNTGTAGDPKWELVFMVTDCADSACAGTPDSNSSEGYFTVDGLTPGGYRLTETRAPDGYVKPAGGVFYTFTVTAGGEASGFTGSNDQAAALLVNPGQEGSAGDSEKVGDVPVVLNVKAASSLPLTGGATGRRWLLVGGVAGGLALMLAGLAGWWRDRRLA